MWEVSLCPNHFSPSKKILVLYCKGSYLGSRASMGIAKKWKNLPPLWQNYTGVSKTVPWCWAIRISNLYHLDIKMLHFCNPGFTSGKLCVTTLILHTRKYVLPNFSVFHSVMNKMVIGTVLFLFWMTTPSRVSFMSRCRQAGSRDFGKWHQRCK